MAMDRVQRRLHRVTAALNTAGVPYAVIGGNAVAAWVAKRRPAATRTTKDVDLLVNRSDLDRVAQALTGLGFEKHDLRRLIVFVDPEEPDRMSGVHLVWAGERVRPSSPHPSPMLDEAVLDAGGFWVIDLPALLRMKLTSFRDIDRAHINDMLSVDLIDDAVRATLPPDLLERLKQVEATIDPLDRLDD